MNLVQHTSDLASPAGSTAASPPGGPAVAGNLQLHGSRLDRSMRSFGVCQNDDVVASLSQQRGPDEEFDMPAIAVRQPWASLLLTGIKTIETRTWPPIRGGRAFRDRVVIYASKSEAFGLTDADKMDVQLANRLALAWWGRPLRMGDQLPKGVVLGTIEIVDHRPMTDVDACSACCAKYDRAISWVCANPVRVQPWRIDRGTLGFFTVKVTHRKLQPGGVSY